MVIEWLKYHIPADQRERYIQLDHEIWTAALSQYPGFLSKETWIDPQPGETVIFVIRWRSREDWKAIPEADLKAIAAQFVEAVGQDYALVEVKEFQVRRFPISA